MRNVSDGSDDDGCWLGQRGRARPATGRAGSDRASTVLVTIRCHGLDFYFLAGGVNGFLKIFFRR